jgi:predicted dehydrogenase
VTRLGVAVIGCGFQGGIHAANVAASSRADLLWCADLEPDRAARLAEETGAGRATERLEDVWEDPDVDAVIIATTTHTHHDLALTAALHGKHMLLEKPMALSVAECLEIERACVEAGVRVVLGYKFRFTAAAIAARAAVPDPRVLVAQTLYDPAPPGASSWVNDRSLSGGRLVSSLVHSVDLLRYLSGDEVIRVFAEAALVSDPSLDQADTSVATLLFARRCDRFNRPWNCCSERPRVDVVVPVGGGRSERHHSRPRTPIESSPSGRGRHQRGRRV